MSKPDLVSEEQLNALLDNELDAEERARILSAIAQDPLLQARHNELLRLKNMLTTAYHDVPQPRPDKADTEYPPRRYLMGAASAALLVVGMLLGWFINAYVSDSSSLIFKNIEQIDTVRLEGEKILLHISTNDSNRVRAALQLAESLLKNSRANHTHLKLEIVANAEGLNILRAGSPYAQEIATMSKEYKNVEFLACGIAKQNARLKEGVDIKLIPQAKDIPAALDQILIRLQQGWTYLRG